MVDQLLRWRRILSGLNRPTGSAAGREERQFANRWLFIVFSVDRTGRFRWGSLLQAPTSSTQDHQPHGATRGRPRAPFPSLARLRLTRRGWLLLWLTATLIALVNGGLLLRGASVTVMVEGRSRSLPAGLTVAQALGRLRLPAAGDLLAIDHSMLRKGAYASRVLVNGQPTPATRRLHRGDRVTVTPAAPALSRRSV